MVNVLNGNIQVVPMVLLACFAHVSVAVDSRGTFRTYPYLSDKNSQKLCIYIWITYNHLLKNKNGNAAIVVSCNPSVINCLNLLGRDT